MNPIHAGPRMTVLGFLSSVGTLAVFIVLAGAELKGWGVLGVLAGAELAVYQAFAVLVKRRRRDLALLRCFGASRGQVFAGVLTEAAWVGAAAAVAGLAAVFLLLDQARWPFAVIAGPIGIGGAVIAALVPAIRASRVPPGNGMV